MQIKYLILLLCLNNSAFVYAGNGTEAEEAEEFHFESFCGQAPLSPTWLIESYPELPASPSIGGDADGYAASASTEPASGSDLVMEEPKTTSFASSAPSSHQSGKAKKRHPREDYPQEDAEKKARRQLKNQESAARSRERKNAYTEAMRLRVIELEAELKRARARIAQLEAERQEEHDSVGFFYSQSASY